MKPLAVLWHIVSRAGAAAAAGLLLGWLFGHALAGLALALAALLAWNLFNLYWLDRWLRERSRLAPPNTSGMWQDVVSGVVRLHRRKRYHKQRLLEVFRELRRSSAAMPDGVVVLNDAWEIVWFNRAAGRLLDLRRRLDPGLRITNLLREPAFARYLAGGRFDEPLVIARGTEPQLYLSLQVVPYGAEQRLLLVRDVSRQMALETMRKDFVANASHELRSPLTVISGYLETLLSEEELDHGLRAPLAEMQRQARRMNDIVGGLLDLSRLDAATQEAGSDDVDVPALLAVLGKDVLARASHPEVRVELNSDAHLAGEQAEILSAFSNLVDNAAKYTPASGLVRLIWEVDREGEGRFTVADTGPGIAPEHVPRLTERFYRVDPGRTRDAGGTGLGLAIVKHVLQHHGAMLEIDSRPGAGSRFTCVFPPRRVRVAHAGGNIGAAPALHPTEA
ncbi:MAG TPA: phosphate regulon sensor histidine kinase PhoR [Steroidobacteraceae bacterium]|nr:phosphate regulon sensor histidine kinase PhoR [Steroidobacteraceae bacterium]